MVVLDESKESFILDVPLAEEVEAKLREEERKKAGRYLAVSVVLFLVSLGLYQAIAQGSTKLSAVFTAAMIMFLYLLWMLYASQRRKRQQKIAELTVDKQVSDVLDNMNNIKNVPNSYGLHDNYVYSSSEEEVEKYSANGKEKQKNQNVQNNKQNIGKPECNTNSSKTTGGNDDLSSKSSKNTGDIFIRTYSIA